MSFLSGIGDKLIKELRSDLLTDLGTLPSEWQDLEISLSIRQHAGKPPHLDVKLVRHTMPGIETESFQVACSRERADYLEKLAQEIRRQMDAPAS
jgi:hypothetical protein